MNSWRWMMVRIAVWIGVMIWVGVLIRTPWKTNALPKVGTTPPGADDPGLMLVALAGVTATKCPLPAGTSLHVRVGATGLIDAYVVPAMEDNACLTRAVWAQTWPALSRAMEMDFEL